MKSLQNLLVLASAQYATSLLAEEISHLSKGPGSSGLIIVVAIKGHPFRESDAHPRICAHLKLGLLEMIPAKWASYQETTEKAALSCLLGGLPVEEILKGDPVALFALNPSLFCSERLGRCNKSKTFSVAVGGGPIETTMLVEEKFFNAMELFMRRFGKYHLAKKNYPTEDSMATFLKETLGRLKTHRRIRFVPDWLQQIEDSVTVFKT